MKQSDFSIGLTVGLVIGVLAILLAHPTIKYVATMPKPEADGHTSADNVTFINAVSRAKVG